MDAAHINKRFNFICDKSIMRRIEVNRAALKIISTEFLFFPITKLRYRTHDSHRTPASKHDQEVNMCRRRRVWPVAKLTN